MASCNKCGRDNATKFYFAEEIKDKDTGKNKYRDAFACDPCYNALGKAVKTRVLSESHQNINRASKLGMLHALKD